MERLLAQIRFIKEIDRLKEITRRSYIMSKNRLENTAEHSWHVALMAFLLAEYANEPIDVAKVVKMMLVHDIVEIEAGDTFCYDVDGQSGKLNREKIAAEKLFGILPEDQGQELRVLWSEFESRATAESRFAACLDRLMPLLHNLNTGGISWQRNGVVHDQVIQFNKHMADGSQKLWEYVVDEINTAVRSGILKS